jgi:hypothetical protein
MLARMTGAQALAGLVAGMLVAPALAHVAARSGKGRAALMIAMALLALVGTIGVGFRPDLFAGLCEGTDLALLHPTWAGVAALALVAALRARAPARYGRALVLLGVAVGASYVHDGSWLVRDPGATLKGYETGGEVCFQSTGWSCAPAAAATLLQKYGIPATEAEMARLMYTRPNRGTNDLHIQRALSRKLAAKGLDARIHAVDYTGLLALFIDGDKDGVTMHGFRTHAVVPVNLTFLTDHVIVVAKVDPEGVTALDPLDGVHRLPRRAFESRWKGRAVVVVRPRD